MSIAIFVVLAVVALGLVISTVYIVPQQRAYIVERLGKFARVSNPGIHFMIPFIEKVVGKIDLRTSQTDLTDIDAKTKDNVTISLEIAVQFRVDTNINRATHISGIYNAFYLLQKPVAQMKSYIADALRSSIPKYNLDEVYDMKDSIANDVQESVANTMIEYGYIVVNTLIVDIKLPADVQSAMNDINATERQKIAAQNKADAERITLVTTAKAKAEAAQEAGRGVALQRTAIAQGIRDSIDVIKEAGINDQEANTIFLYTQWLDMMQKFGENNTNSTVVLPADFEETRSMFDQMVTANKLNR